MQKLSTAPFSASKKSGTKRENPPCTPLRVKAKGKETRPGYSCNALRPPARVRTREERAANYRLAGAAADELIAILGGNAARDRAVLGALMVDWRTAPAAKIAGVSRPTVDSWKTKLKTHFAQCWRAYERDFAN